MTENMKWTRAPKNSYITDDLSDFSEELQERIKFIYSGGYNNPDNRNRL